MGDADITLSAEELEVLAVMRSGEMAGEAVYKYARNYTHERVDPSTEPPYTQ